jgi:hypothetical protein
MDMLLPSQNLTKRIIVVPPVLNNGCPDQSFQETVNYQVVGYMETTENNFYYQLARCSPSKNRMVITATSFPQKPCESLLKFQFAA